DALANCVQLIGSEAAFDERLALVDESDCAHIDAPFGRCGRHKLGDSLLDLMIFLLPACCNVGCYWRRVVASFDVGEAVALPELRALNDVLAGGFVADVLQHGHVTATRGCASPAGCPSAVRAGWRGFPVGRS